MIEPGKRPPHHSLMSFRPFKPLDPHSVCSFPNLITLVRLGLSLSFFVLAILKNEETYNFIGLGVHWLGDVLDGMVARRFNQETILGAEIDIIADRVETLFFYLIFLSFHPQLYLPAVVYIVDFAFVDFYLSYQFLKFGLISPNYFFKIDRKVYQLNYSPAGKFCNSTVVTLIVIFFPRLWLLAAIWAAGLIGVKIYSFLRLNKKRSLDKKDCH